MPLTSQLRSHHELHELRERVQPHLYRWRYWERVTRAKCPVPSPAHRRLNGGASGWTSSGNRLFAMNYQETPERARLKVVEGGWAGPGQRVGGKVSIRGE